MVSKIDSISSAIATANIQMESANTTRSALRVYVSGLTIPFLLSGGSAEGWCNATIRESNKYQISSLRYTAAFMAEATISALVKGAPIMWTLYDVSFMDGSHE